MDTVAEAPIARRSRLVAEVDWDADGVQHGFVRLFHSTHASAYGFIPIPVVVIRNGAGPTALFTGGTHGDEYEGQVALAKLARWLKPEMMRGRVIIMPQTNHPAAVAGLRVSPLDDVNLNRVFPGDANGSVTQQIAFFIEHEVIPRADLVCDLHSGGSSLNYVPTALMKRSDDAAYFARGLAALRAFGAPLAYVALGAQGQGADQTLSGGGERRGIIALGSELGGGGTVNPSALRIAERGLRNLLVHLEMLPDSFRESGEPTRVLEVGGADYFVYAPEPGVCEPLVELGDTVRSGQPAALVHTPETPWREPTEVRFARDGFVLCKRIPGRTVR
ncbi:MAG: succinylglutamate desuccinylase/aspartoacylase family protein, partial [Acidisphaera sp.]|nr:succinylglutamate desuccinylase/aspartoacylase family protein [Acidisphaera sp.]